jgi:N-acetylneuraminic acid mutarotase
MPIGSYASAAHALGDKIFVLPLYDSGGFRNELLEYTPATNLWRTRTPRSTHRYELASAAVNGKLYVLGGTGTIDDGPWESGKPWSLKSHVEIYDPASNSWTTGQAAPMPFSTSNQSCAHGGAIYVLGGRTNLAGGPEPFVLKYDTAANTWSATTPMRTPYRDGAACAAVDGKFYIGGGSSVSGILDLVERYDPLQQTWTSPTRLPTRRARVLAAALGSEIVFLSGNTVTGNEEVSVDLVEIVDTEIL